MTVPAERSWAVMETHRFLVRLRSDETLPDAIRAEAHRLLRHYPSKADVIRAAHHELAEPRLVLEPVFAKDPD